MKGFIEVYVYSMYYANNNRVERKINSNLLINVKEIKLVSGCHITLEENDMLWDLSCREDYEEIKQKIKEAQEEK